MPTKVIPVTRCGDITFHPNGRIDLTAHVTAALSLHPGDVINIARVEERFCEHYLYVARRAGDTIGRHAGTCRPAKNNGRYLRVFCKRLTDYVLTRSHNTAGTQLRVGAVTEVSGLGIALPLIGLF